MNIFKNIKVYFTFSNQVNVLLAILISLVTSDGILSNFLINKGLAIEANPVMRGWVGSIDFLAIKLAGGFLAAILLWDFSRRHPKIAFVSAICCVIFYTAIIYWNLITFVVAAL